jgi:endonuclease G
MKKFLAALVIAVSTLVSAPASYAASTPCAIASVEAPLGLPTDKVVGTQLCHKAYVLKHDDVAKIPVWVAYTLTPKHSEGCVPRQDSFIPDPLLPVGKRAELKDYTNSGYDKGHLANNADMAWDLNVDKESFLLSNMAPQIHPFNAGIWEELETNVRGWAFNRQHTMQVYTGPIYGPQDKTIGPNKVVVPHAFYKIVIDTATKEEMDFEFPHQALSIKNDMTPYLVPESKIEKDTGITFPVPGNKAVAAKSVWPDDIAKFTADKKAVCAATK